MKKTRGFARWIAFTREPRPRLIVGSTSTDRQPGINYASFDWLPTVIADGSFMNTVDEGISRAKGREQRYGHDVTSQPCRPAIGGNSARFLHPFSIIHIDLGYWWWRIVLPSRTEATGQMKDPNAPTG